MARRRACLAAAAAGSAEGAREEGDRSARPASRLELAAPFLRSDPVLLQFGPSTSLLSAQEDPCSFQIRSLLAKSVFREDPCLALV